MNRKIPLSIAIVVIGTFAALTVPKLAETPVPFKHSVHLEEGAECAECHKQGEGKPGMVLNKEYCLECHEDGVPAYTLPARSRKLKAAFPHKLHVESAECTDCHGYIKTDEIKAGAPALGFDKCTACHSENEIVIEAGNCNACHAKNMRLVEPSDHKGLWMKLHGDESNWRVFDEHGKDCRTCHGDDSCTTCHKETRPRSHTGLWRMRGHGLEAGWDRESCKTCHETGTCIRCHKETQPLSHKGPWKYFHGLAAETTGNEHCATCHSPGQCAQCHANQ